MPDPVLPLLSAGEWNGSPAGTEPCCPQKIPGAIVSPTATVKLEINGVEKETSNTGVGPVDAALNAIRELIQDTMHIELEEYNLEAINGGTDALADVFVISSDNEGNKSTGRAIDDDIVMASILAVLDSINKLLLMKKTEEELNL